MHRYKMVLIVCIYVYHAQYVFLHYIFLNFWGLWTPRPSISCDLLPARENNLLFYLASVFLRNCHVDVHGSCTNLQSHQQWDCSTSSPAWTVACIIDLSHSDRRKMESHSSFDFKFPDGEGCVKFLQVFLSHLIFPNWELSFLNFNNLCFHWKQILLLCKAS